MTKEEILAMISEKIAGQGTNVDGGGALNDILKGIVGLIPEKDSLVTIVDFPELETVMTPAEYKDSGLMEATIIRTSEGMICPRLTSSKVYEFILGADWGDFTHCQDVFGVMSFDSVDFYAGEFYAILFDDDANHYKAVYLEV